MKRKKERGEKDSVPVIEQSAVVGKPGAVTRAGQGRGKERPSAAGMAGFRWNDLDRAGRKQPSQARREATADQARTRRRLSRGQAQGRARRETLRTRIRQRQHAPDPTVGVGKTMSASTARPESSNRRTVRSTRSRRSWRGLVRPRAARGPKVKSRRRQPGHPDPKRGSFYSRGRPSTCIKGHSFTV